MLPRPEAPARRLPYTTADMAERLAKKKAEQDAASFKAFPGGVTKPFDQNGGASKPSWLSQVGNMAKSLVLTAPATILDAIPYVANIPGVKGEGAWGYEPEDIGTSNFFQAGGQALEQSTRHLVGDVTAIPGLGKDSPSYTADQIRKYGVAEGLASAGLDYGNLALTVAPFVKPTGWAIGNAINDAKYAAYLRRTKSPFPDVAPPKPGTFIDVDALQSSRLPARVVDSPATPATRLAEAQTQRQIITTPSTQLPAEYLALSNEAPTTPAFTTPVEANQYLAGNGSLEQLEKVSPEYLWEAVENNSTASLPSGRFKQIGSAGGHIGMDRYVDLATGQHLGLKYRPGGRYLFKKPTRQLNGFSTAPLEGPLGEILSNEVAVALGFPDMNLRLIVNGDETVSIITDLAQDVYGGKILDSHDAANQTPTNPWSINSISDAPAGLVPVENRIRMAVLDLLIDNGDRNVSNVLFSVDETGGVRLVPIDHEITFFPARDSGIGYPAAMNFSVRRAYKDDPTKLFETIKATITKIQDDLQNSQIVKRFESKLLETTKKVGIDFTDLNAADKWDFDSQIQSFENKVKAYLSADPEELAQKYIDQIKEWVNP